MQPLTRRRRARADRRARVSPLRGRRAWVEGALLATAVAIPLVTRDGFLADRLGKFFLFAVFAISVDLVWGYGGMFTFGHAAFFGWAGYVVGIATTRDYGPLPVGLWVAVPLAVALSALLALAIGYFVFSGRLALRGVDFAVVTLAISFLSERLADAGGQVTGGQNGILMNVRLETPWFGFHKNFGFYVFALALLIGAYLFSRWFVGTRTGLILRGIRQNEDRVALLGYDVSRVKRGVFVLSGAMAGLAGALFYVHDGIVSPGAVGVQLSTLVLLWVVLGGRGTLLGPVVGAVALPYLTARLSGTLLDTWLVVVGVLLVAVIVLLPAGIFGYLTREDEG